MVMEAVARGVADLAPLLQQSAALHRHLCPRQVLGVRMGLLAGKLLHMELPRRDKRLLVFMETDGCAADGVSVATGCWVGRRTMRILDFGKVAATFYDTKSQHAVRIHPSPNSRRLARQLLPKARSRWHAQQEAYQILPDQQLLVAQEVILELNVAALISRPGVRVTCESCGEEIINERQIFQDGRLLCRPCAGEVYYKAAGPGTVNTAGLMEEPRQAT